MKIIQKGFNYSQDGPGNRLVYHLQGCNMRCPWCANPEGLPMDGLTMTVRDEKRGRMVEKCSYKEYSIDEMVEEVLRSKSLFFESGGVTFTGGEPTMQFDELKELMIRLREAGIHICMENNGTHVRLPELIESIDYLIMDFKHPMDEIHKSVTGVSNRTIIDNLERILASGRQIALRIPLIHGFNDTEEAERGFLEFFQNHDMTSATLEILPYHEYGKEKWQQCGMEYTVEDGHVAAQRVKELENRFQEAGVRIIHT